MKRKDKNLVRFTIGMTFTAAAFQAAMSKLAHGAEPPPRPVTDIVLLESSVVFGEPILLADVCRIPSDSPLGNLPISPSMGGNVSLADVRRALIDHHANLGQINLRGPAMCKVTIDETVVQHPADADETAIATPVQATLSAVVPMEQHYAVALASPVRRGQVIRAQDVRLEPADEPSSQHFAAIEDVLGQKATRDLNAGDLLDSRHLELPPLITRGQSISVRAGSGTVTIRIAATAQESGAFGQAVRVKTADGRTHMVTVVGPQEATLTPAQNLTEQP